MRLSLDSLRRLRRVVMRDLAIEFVPPQLTPLGGLELLRRYVERFALAGRCILRGSLRSSRSSFLRWLSHHR